MLVIEFGIVDLGSTEYINNYGPRARYMKGLVCINIWGARKH
jgi:hypothetical protein